MEWEKSNGFADSQGNPSLPPPPPPLSRHIKTVFQVRKIRIYLFTQQRELTGDAGVEFLKIHSFAKIFEIIFRIY
jgi:hypothetical protein